MLLTLRSLWEGAASGGTGPDGRWFPPKKKKRHWRDVEETGFVVLPRSLAAMTAEAEAILGSRIAKDEALDIITILLAAKFL